MRIPVADDYAAALGRATYTFAYLKWGIVWLTETLSHDFLKTVGGMTAGTIALEFGKLAARSSDPDAADLRLMAASFRTLVGERNAMLHGVPYTAENGEQRLRHIGRSGQRDWSIESLEAATKAFEDAAIEASRLLHAGRYEAYTATGRSLSI